MQGLKRHLAQERRKMLYALGLIVTLPVIGTLGYMIIEGYQLLDAIYMTVITIATVGFREIHPLSDAGKVFTIMIIIFSIGTFAYAVSVLTSQFIEGQMAHLLRIYRTESSVKKMKKHVIVVGYGRNGKQAAKELADRKKPYIVIDQNHDLVQLHANSGIPFLQGDATEDEVLIKAGIHNAQALISTLPLDADNLFVTLTARTLNKTMNIITRASSDSSERKLRAAGADSVVMPEKVGGSHMATMVLQPDVVQFLEHLSFHDHSSTNLVELLCSNLPDEYHNKTIEELMIRKLSGANIIGFKTAEGRFIINPSPDTVIIPNSKLFVLGTADQINKVKEFFES